MRTHDYAKEEIAAKSSHIEIWNARDDKVEYRQRNWNRTEALTQAGTSPHKTCTQTESHH